MNKVLTPSGSNNSPISIGRATVTVLYSPRLGSASEITTHFQQMQQLIVIVTDIIPQTTATIITQLFSFTHVNC